MEFFRSLPPDAIVNMTTEADDLDVTFCPSGTSGFGDLKRDAIAIEMGGIAVDDTDPATTRVYVSGITSGNVFRIELAAPQVPAVPAIGLLALASVLLGTLVRATRTTMG